MKNRAPTPNFSKSGSSRPFKPVQTDFQHTLLAPTPSPYAWYPTRAGVHDERGLLMGCGAPPPHPDTPRTACEAETPTSGCVGGGLASRCSGAGRRRRTDSKERPQTRPNRQKRLSPHLTCCPESLPQKSQRKAAVPQLNSIAAADADGLLMGCGPPPTHTHPERLLTACRAEIPSLGVG